MMQYQPFSPADIRFATLPELGEQLSPLADQRVMIVASEGTLKRLNACEGLKRLLAGQRNRLVCDIRPNPSVDDVLRIVNDLRHEERCGSIVAIGGGSCIDLAKAISALQGLADTRDLVYGEMVEAIAQKRFFQGYEPADIIAIPTTAGTGSEVTKWATVWDFRNSRKLSVEHHGCFPKVALMVPELTASMPQRLTLATGLDALSHAMEGFWAKKRNPLSQALAADAIERVRRALPLALKDRQDLEVRKEMCLASLLAGLAFSMTRTTACHSISYPLTLNYGVEHGFAAALTLKPMMGINVKAVPELTEITGLFGGAEGFGAWIADVAQGIQELRLSAFGIRRAMIDGIVQGAFTLGRMDNNPVPLEPESVRTMLESIL